MSDYDDDDYVPGDENFDFEMVEPEAAKPAKASKGKGKGKAKAKAKKSAPIAVDSDDDEPLTEAGATGATEDYSKKFQKKTQLEHILLRPDTYIGSVEPVEQPMWVFNRGTKQLEERPITFTPGLYKIFDEILVNAADNKQNDASMAKVEVVIDQEAGSVSVLNDGKGIPVVVHSEHGVYIPEMIFGQLLTSTNYDDSKKKVTGGRNGYGAKLANIFSTEFTVETSSSETGKKYKQTWSNNMGTKGKASITKAAKKDFTRVTFKPDFERFKMTHLDDDTVALMCKRVYDIAGVTDRSVKVTLNGERVPVDSFSKYVDMYLGSGQEGGAGETKDAEMDGSAAAEAPPKMFVKVNDRWEVGVSISDGQFQQVSFVNSICTTKGGQHVNYIADQLTAALVKSANKGNKSVLVKAHHVKNHLKVFVNCLIENPAFDSQTKETLTTRAKAFGSTAVLPDKFVKAVSKSGIVDNILMWARMKQNAELKRKGGVKKSKLSGIPKLDDANFAGGAKGKDCTLILTEGDSAKALAVSGLSVVGRDYFGVFPLRGKLLNVREANHKQIMANAEIQSITKIMGLQFGKTYDDTKGLRYGHILIMADQDHDGSHIKGLVINFLHHFWPSLLKVDGFLQEFITPIVKCSKGKKVIPFFTMPEYEEWLEENNAGKGWKIKYYKGLGTSTAAEAKEYFADITTHRIEFEHEGAVADDRIDLAFSKKRVEHRKQWLTAFVPGTHVDYDVDSMHYSEFVDKELILFSMADNIRSIPSVVDGFKPSQRKVLFSCFKRKLTQEIKVAQLAGYVSEHSAYHHGEQSLAATITGMAQDFVGSNNINVLFPAGQFGTRHMAGKDSASPRYIYTRLAEIARAVFHEADDELLDYQEEDGQTIEPEWYLPIVPMALINGSDGIGTGWSSSVPCFNPRDVIANLRAAIGGAEMAEMTPWYRNYQGAISRKDAHTFHVCGQFERDGDVVTITELPLKKATQDYKAFLESVMVGGTADAPKTKAAKGKGKGKATKGKAAAAASGAGDDDGASVATTATTTKSASDITTFVKEFKENHTDTSILFTVKLTPEAAATFTDTQLRKKLKLDTTVSTNNMHLFDAAGHIKRYDTPEDIIREFFELRLEYYQRRKAALLSKITDEWVRLDNKMRFIQMVIDGELSVSNRKKSELLAELQTLGFKAFPPASKKKAAAAAGADGEEEDDEEGDGTDVAVQAKAYNYLLSMAIWTLTNEKVEKLRAEVADKKAELESLRATTSEQMWLNDLDALEAALEFADDAMAANAKAEGKARRAFNKANKKGKGGGSAKAGGAARRARKAKSADNDESDSDFDGGDDSDFEPAAAKVKKAPARKQKRAPAAVPIAAAPKPSVGGAAVAAVPKPKAVAPPPAPAAPVAEEDAASDAESEEEEEILSLAERLMKRMNVTPKKEAAKPKRAAAAKASKAVAAAVADSDDGDEDDDDAFDMEASDDDDDDDEFTEAAAEVEAPAAKPVKRTQSKAKGKPTSKTPTVTPQPKKRRVKATTPLVDDASDEEASDGGDDAFSFEGDDSDDSEFGAAAAAKPKGKGKGKKAAAKPAVDKTKAKATKAATKATKAAPKPKAKPAAKKAAPKKKQPVVQSDSEDDFAFEGEASDDSDADAGASAGAGAGAGEIKPKTPRKRRQAAAKAKYVFDSEDDEEEESDFSDGGGDDGSDSDFE